MSSVALLFSFTVIVAAEIAVVAASVKKLKYHRNGRFYESHGGMVLELEFTYTMSALVFTIGTAWLGVGTQSDLGFILAIAPAALAVRAVWIAAYPDAIVRRWNLDRRQDSTLTGPIRTSVPLTRDQHPVDTYDGDDD